MGIKGEFNFSNTDEETKILAFEELYQSEDALDCAKETYWKDIESFKKTPIVVKVVPLVKSDKSKAQRERSLGKRTSTWYALARNTSGLVTCADVVTRVDVVTEKIDGNISKGDYKLRYRIFGPEYIAEKDYDVPDTFRGKVEWDSDLKEPTLVGRGYLRRKLFMLERNDGFWDVLGGAQSYYLFTCV